jgi:hypothetical protein
VFRLIWRQRGAAVTAEVRADNGVLLRQEGGNTVPRCMGARMSVQQYDRWALTSVSNPQRHLTDVELIKCESIEHPYRLPGFSAAEPAVAGRVAIAAVRLDQNNQLAGANENRSTIVDQESRGGRRRASRLPGARAVRFGGEVAAATEHLGDHRR